MLIPLKPILQKFNIWTNGVIHVGAHWLEEWESYQDCGIRKVVAIEPCNPAFQVLKNRFEDNENVRLFKCACGEKEAWVQMYTETENHGQSNSILKPKLHLQQHKEITFTGIPETVRVVRLDDLAFERKGYGLLMIDVQGYEDRVLNGAPETLKTVDIVYAEINRGETYETNPLVEDLDMLLPEFTRVETKWASPNLTWGDGIWIRTNLLPHE